MIRRYIGWRNRTQPHTHAYQRYLPRPRPSRGRKLPDAALVVVCRLVGLEDSDEVPRCCQRIPQFVGAQLCSNPVGPWPRPARRVGSAGRGPTRRTLPRHLRNRRLQPRSSRHDAARHARHRDRGSRRSLGLPLRQLRSHINLPATRGGRGRGQGPLHRRIRNPRPPTPTNCGPSLSSLRPTNSTSSATTLSSPSVMVPTYCGSSSGPAHIFPTPRCGPGAT